MTKGIAIEVIANEDAEYLPWTFRWPPIGPAKKLEEPTNHPAGVKQLTKVMFGIPVSPFQNKSTSFFNSESGIRLESAVQHLLTLESDQGKKGYIKTFRNIPLTIAD